MAPLMQVAADPSGMAIGLSSALLLVLGMGLVAGLLLLFWAIGWWWTNRSTPASLYGGGSLRRGDELSYTAVQHAESFLGSLDHSHHPHIDLSKAGVCEATGRIFPATIGAWDELRLSWRFLRTYYSGQLVSWGSLTPAEKTRILQMHTQVEGYQLNQSSARPRPQDVERDFALLKPGPLYVDPTSGVLLGWQCIPCTELETLVLSLPRKNSFSAS